MKQTIFQISLVTLIMTLTAIMLSLGFWQLDRAAQKKTLLSSHAQGLTQDPLPITAQTLISELNQFHPVIAKGQYLVDQQILWDNRFYQHQVGYEVLTPLDLGDKIILVNRGWVPRGATRQQRPDVHFIDYSQPIYGNIHFLSGGLVLGQEEINEDWPRVIQQIDYDHMADWLNKPVIPVIVRLDAKQTQGYVRDWPITTMPPERHIAYAIQWFALAITLVILSILVYVKSRKRKPKT